jgi:hypothetical protein
MTDEVKGTGVWRAFELKRDEKEEEPPKQGGTSATGKNDATKKAPPAK